MNALLIGYGNTLRSDDGAGVRAVEALAASGLPSGVETLNLQQLTPDLSERLAQVDLAVFIDAAAEGDQPGAVQLQELLPQPSTSNSVTHFFDPAALLALSQALYGSAPRAYLCTITPETFDLGEELSPAVAAAIPIVVEQVRSLLS